MCIWIKSYYQNIYQCCIKKLSKYTFTSKHWILAISFFRFPWCWILCGTNQLRSLCDPDPVWPLWTLNPDIEGYSSRRGHCRHQTAGWRCSSSYSPPFEHCCSGPACADGGERLGTQKSPGRETSAPQLTAFQPLTSPVFIYSYSTDTDPSHSNPLGSEGKLRKTVPCSDICVSLIDFINSDSKGVSYFCFQHKLNYNTMATGSWSDSYVGCQLR